MSDVRRLISDKLCLGWTELQRINAEWNPWEVDSRRSEKITIYTFPFKQEQTINTTVGNDPNVSYHQSGST